MPETHLKPGQLQSAFCLFTGISSFICTALRAPCAPNWRLPTLVSPPPQRPGTEQVPNACLSKRIKEKTVSLLMDSTHLPGDERMNVRLCSVRCKNENKCHLKVGGLRVRDSAAEPLCDGECLAEHCCSQGFLQPHRNHPKPFYSSAIPPPRTKEKTQKKVATHYIWSQVVVCFLNYKAWSRRTWKLEVNLLIFLDIFRVCMCVLVRGLNRWGRSGHSIYCPSFPYCWINSVISIGVRQIQITNLYYTNKEYLKKVTHVRR